MTSELSIIIGNTLFLEGKPILPSDFSTNLPEEIQIVNLINRYFEKGDNPHNRKKIKELLLLLQRILFPKDLDSALYLGNSHRILSNETDAPDYYHKWRERVEAWTRNSDMSGLVAVGSSLDVLELWKNDSWNQCLHKIRMCPLNSDESDFKKEGTAEVYTFRLLGLNLISEWKRDDKNKNICPSNPEIKELDKALYKIVDVYPIVTEHTSTDWEKETEGKGRICYYTLCVLPIPCDIIHAVFEEQKLLYETMDDFIEDRFRRESEKKTTISCEEREKKEKESRERRRYLNLSYLKEYGSMM